jgi:hypothetical protein
MFYGPPFFRGHNKKKCANYASKFGIFSEIEVYAVQIKVNVLGMGRLQHLARFIIDQQFVTPKMVTVFSKL